MSNEGYWLNANTGCCETIEDHAEYLVIHKNAVRIGLPSDHEKLVRGFDWDLDRMKIMTIAMEAGLVRIRSLGTRVMCQFTYPVKSVLPHLASFFEKNCFAEQFTHVELSNVKSMTVAEMSWREFENLCLQSPSRWPAVFKKLPASSDYEEIQEGLRLAAFLNEKTSPHQKRAGRLPAKV
ncbi:MAG: hypothetical protein HQM09_17555 [Candidatus Riflebacteria bacterium]|nr:hypothetical protein [Candidatus Riflebacteria bacterium]